MGAYIAAMAWGTSDGDASEQIMARGPPAGPAHVVVFARAGSDIMVGAQPNAGGRIAAFLVAAFYNPQKPRPRARRLTRARSVRKERLQRPVDSR